MNYSPEHLTDALLETLLPRVDPDRTSTFVEIGCGTGNFSFVMARRLGYKALAVEPVCPQHAHAVGQECGVTVYSVAIADHDGHVMMRMHPNGDDDFASMLPNWTPGGKEFLYPSLTLKTFLQWGNVTGISCLKLDVEGAENIILRQLKDLPVALLPKIVVFEYGGGGNRSEGKGGWTEEHFTNTVECINTVRDLGYVLGWRFDCNLGGLEIDGCTNSDVMFPPNSHYGNIVLERTLS